MLVWGMFRFAARTVLACAGVLMFWSAMPIALGWQSTLIMSGSMLPRIQPGDVVIAQPVQAQQLLPGQVVLVVNPARPDTLLVHRMARRGPDGTLVTKGDANEVEDSSPVPPGNVRGLARLRVPYVGRPVLWMRERSYERLAGFAVVLGVVVALAGGGGPAGRPARRAPRHRARSAR